MTRIPLPPGTIREGFTGHPFPLRIAYQTMEFLQGTFFFFAFGDIAAGEAVRQQEGVSKIEKYLIEKGLAPEVPDRAWFILQRYQPVFEGMLFQSSLIALNSQWDWYIRRLCEFICFGRSHISCPSLTDAQLKRLHRASHIPISDQLEIVQIATGIDLQIGAQNLSEIVEMSLVRNLGLHNRWEVDPFYLEKTSQTGLAPGDLRLVAASELLRWDSILNQLIKRSSVECAKLYVSVPEFGD